MYHTYKEIEEAIKNVRPFTGNSASGVIIGNELVISSYTTVIAKVKSDGTWSYFDDSYFGSTTNKLQDIIRKHCEVD